MEKKCKNIAIAILVIVIILLFGDKVKATTVPTETDKWAIQMCSTKACGYSIAESDYYRDYENVNSGAYNLNSIPRYLTAVRLRQTFTATNYLQNGQMYEFKYKLWFNPKDSDFNLYYYTPGWEYDFTVTDSNNNQITVDEGDYSCSVTSVKDANSWFLTCYYIPTARIKQVYIRIRFPFQHAWESGVNFSSHFYSGYINTINYTSSKISTSNNELDAINNLNVTFIDQTNMILDVIDSDHTYDIQHDAGNLTQGSEKNTYVSEETALRNSLDISAVEDMDIVINPNASWFIWEIVRLLRSINGKIVLLFTSILGLGIMKMILNR